MKDQVIELVLKTKVIAIIRGLDSGYEKLVQAMYDGGIRAVEVTFNQKDPALWSKTTGAISTIRALMGDKMAVGAGTVTSVELAELAYEAGAQFIVSPDTDPAVIRRTAELGMVSMPGALTPTEIKQAHIAGADFVKVFPAGNLGAGYIKAIRGPLNHIRLLAVGGVSEKNAADFIAAGCVGIGVGGNLVNKEWIEKGDFHKIAQTARELCEAVTK
ncbi:MAG: bifunctional 4-hydroxy-2-oxoglutarate aldolase/2-dehydro-3-deoxy-phosphogluconate aldolase [Oscillospiraceae bacterium]|nr:bifunctional 4-hydroxy-2-oxoglutarate aldolase/2-dehydro-3-deoxy-phosphogluconate aldolase [Oscillospiraceae bacterium]